MSLRRFAIRPNTARAVSLAFTASYAPRIGTRLSSTAPATIVDRSFWRSLVPKPLRKENRQLNKKSKQWNPATFFIAIFLLIGSMSIQMIALRNSFDRYMRQSEARIMALRDVVEKIQRGEPVDVEKALGTGDPKKEADWEEMLKAIERDEAARKAKQEKAKQSEPPAAAPVVLSEEQTPENEAAPKKAKSSNLGNFF
ncbi:hypothetical protein ACHAPT_002992 [Fusarium lateritium]